MTDSSHFEVSYKINPWMTPEAWRANEARNRAAARAAQSHLAKALRHAGARVTIMEGVAGLPDMVFPANAAVVLNGRAMVSRFRYHERQGEERHFFSKFMRLKERGLLRDVTRAPKGRWQEGAGDCIWDATRQLFWAGFGPRSSFEAIAAIKDYFGAPVVPLELVSGQYYHLDTCFAVLSGGEILYYPPAFSKVSLAAIRDRVPAGALIEASDEDAERFAVNAVNIGRAIVMAEPPQRLVDRLAGRGYSVAAVGLAPFIMSGGGA
jgi:N-dimethylarginine dimethylaminohydrolase